MTIHFVPLARPTMVSRAHVLADSPAVLTVVRGAAGTGKTTLLAEHARALASGERAVVWVTLTAEDGGHGPFLARVVDRLVLAGIVEASAVEHAVVGEPTAVARHVERVLEEVAHPLVLVLDDYHHVADPAADETLIQYVERGVVTLLVATRHGDDLQSARTAARVATRLVDSRMLSFTVEETAQLLDASGVGETSGVAELIHRATAGWPLASYALVVEAQRGTLDLSGAARGRLVRDILASSIVGRDARLFRFALVTSLADEITPELAAELSGESVDRARHDLAALESAGLGSWRTGSSDDAGSGDQLAFHPLVQEELAAQARKHLDAAEVRRGLTVVASDASARRPGRAFELFVEAREWDRAERLLRRTYGPLTALHRATVAAALDTVPRDVLDSHPVLAGTRTLLDYGNRGSLGARFTQGLKLMSTLWRERTQPADGLDGLANAAFAMGAYRLTGDAARARQLADTAVARLASIPEKDIAGEPTLVPTILTQVAMTYIYLEEYDTALHHLSTVVALASRGGTAGQTLHALSLIALAHAVRGDMPAAHSAIEQAEVISGPAGWRESYLGAGYRIARAHEELERGDPDAAVIELDALNGHPTIEHWPYIVLARARAAMMRRGLEAGVAEVTNALARMRWRPSPLGPHRAALAGFTAELLALAGQVPRAEQAAAQEESAQRGRPRLSQARIALAKGAYARAATAASEVSWSSHAMPRLRAESILVDAQAQWASGHQAEATARLEQGLALMAEFGLSTPALGVPRSVLEAIAAQGAVELGALTRVAPLEGPVPVARPLTRGERAVLQALLDGSTVRDAAARLHVSDETIRFHLKSVYRKLGVNSRNDALHRASSLGLITASPE